MRPYVIISFTQSIDGKIAAIDGYSKLSCPEDKKRQYWLRCNVDAVVVGANTVIVDNPRLYPKMCMDRKVKYYRIVIDGSLRVPSNARIFDVSRYPTIVLTSDDAPQSKISDLTSRGVEVIRVGKNGRVDLSRALDVLSERFGIRSLMVEGGGETIWSFIEANAFDELRVTLAPLVFGGHSAVPSIGGTGFRGEEAPRLELTFAALCLCESEIHLIYQNPKARDSQPLRIGTLNNFSRVLIDRGGYVT